MMMKKLAAAACAVALLCGQALAASTVNPGIPAQNAPLNSAPIRNNFAAAAADINNILGCFSGTSAPTIPTRYQFWCDTSASPNIAVKQYDGTSWVSHGTLNISAHSWTPVLSAGSLVGTAPITVSVSGGVATIGVAIDSNFTVTAGSLAFANIASGSLLANSAVGAAAPTATTATAWLDRWCGSVNDTFPYRTGGVWGCLGLLGTAHTWTGVQTLQAPIISGGTADALTSLGIRSTGAAFDMKFATSEAISANRTLSLTLNNASRTLSLAGNVTIGGTFSTGSTFSTTGAFSTGNTFSTTGTFSSGGNFATGSTLSTTGAFSTGGAFSTAAAFTQAGAFGTTLTSTATTNSTLPAGTHTLAGLDVAQTWTAIQQFNSGTFLLKGASSGTLDMRAPATASTSVLTWPAGTTDFSATGGTSQFVKQASAGAALTVVRPACADLSDSTFCNVSLTNGITNGNLAQPAANTFKGNPTASPATPTDFTIDSLTQKVTLAVGDKVAISDSAASGALKYVLASAFPAGGGVSSFNGQTGAVVLDNTPGGRLTLASPNGCAINTDQVAMTTIYYAPCGHVFVPIYNGTSMPMTQFTANAADATGLSVALGANWTASTLYDWYIGLDSGTVRLCSGPGWTNSGLGTSTRGTGAGTTQLAMLNGIWTNAVSMTCRYANASTFTCAVNQCTYVGTTLTATAAGQITLKFGTAATANAQLAILSICNMYNRQDVRVSSSDTTASWATNTGVWRAANQNLTGTHIVSCLGDVGINATYQDGISSVGGAAYVGIGLNSSTVLASRASTAFGQGAATTFFGVVSSLREIMPTGLNAVYAIEQAGSTGEVFYGGSAMTFTADARM